MSSQRISIRVTLEPDGKTPRRLLVYDGVEIGDVSYVDLVDFIAQAVGTFRWEQKRFSTFLWEDTDSAI